MELIRGLINLRRQASDCVATIGKFDGIHLGHQQIIASVIARAKALSLPAVVILFEPDPQEYFAGNTAPARLTRFREKWLRLQQLGVDKVLCIRFNSSFARLSAATFVDQLLLEKLRTRHLVVGDDFRFGHQRQGDYSFLKSRESDSFKVQSTQSIKCNEHRISSTYIRELLDESQFETVAQVLGRPFTMFGRVLHGQKLGRTLGFPTINVAVLRKVVPLKGVFLVTVTGINENPLTGVANIGMRPTVGGVKPVLEVYLFNYSGDCYGAQVTITFQHKLRDEQKFATLDELKEQIQRDVALAKKQLTQ